MAVGRAVARLARVLWPYSIGVRCLIVSDPKAFAARVAPFLARRPVEHNLVVTLLSRTLAGEPLADDLLLACVEDVSGALACVALRTPLRPLVVSRASQGAVDALSLGLARSGIDLPGVTGPDEAASAFASAWQRLVGGVARSVRSMGVYALEDVTVPAGNPSGRLRPARAAERELLVHWASALGEEIGEAHATPERTVERQMSDRRLFGNLTSNAIYQRVGYRRVGDASEYRFTGFGGT